MPQHSDDPAKAKAQAEQKIEGKNALIRLAKRRQRKWERKRKAKRKGTPAYQRADRKVLLWKRRKHDAIYVKHQWQQILADSVKALAKRIPVPRRLLDVAFKYVGAQEGGSFHQRAVEFVGALMGWPWCSIAVAEWLHEALGYRRDELPDNAPYSGCWAAWKGGKRVAISKRSPGDIEVYDWGDGGMTDHVAVNVSSSEHIGGNQSPGAGQVNVRSTPPGAIVFVVRPRKRG